MVGRIRKNSYARNSRRMKKDIIYLLGGLAVGGVLFYAFKDLLIGEKKENKSTDSNDNEMTMPISNEDVSVGNTIDSGTQIINESQSQTTSSVQQQPTALPYALTPIDPSLAATQAHQDMFGGCNFPIVPESSSVCVERLQDALDVDQTGLFDMATQEAYDSFIEGMPNRADGNFSGYGRQGCITSDPQSGDENLCGLNHDQYLEILFKMGIPLTQTYDE